MLLIKKESLSKTRLRLLGKEGNLFPDRPVARIKEMFPEIPDEVDNILFDVSGEPLFPGKPE